MSGQVSDYPDWLRVDQWVGSPFMQGVTPAVVDGTTFGPFFVAPWEAVEFQTRIAGSSPATAMTLNIGFYADAALTIFISAAVIDVVANGVAFHALPVQGAYMAVTLSTGTAARDLALWIVPVRGYNNAKKLWSGVETFHVSALSIGAGVTFSSIVLNQVSGPATFSVWTFAAAWDAYILVNAITGANLGIMGKLGTAADANGGTVRVDIPPRAHTIAIVNRDAAAKTFYGLLVPSIE